MKMSTEVQDRDVCGAWLLRPQLPDSAARCRGQGGAPGWTNDLDHGEGRGSVGLWRGAPTAKRRARRRAGEPAPRVSLSAWLVAVPRWRSAPSRPFFLAERA